MLIKKNSQRIKKDSSEKQKEVVREELGKVEAPSYDSAAELVSEEQQATSEENLAEKIFDIDNLDFSQRVERRSGTRRRGYRRIDDRKLVSRSKDEADNIKRTAFEEGYKAGLEKATEDIQFFKNQLGIFLTAQKEVFEYIAPDILEISVDIARRIIKKEVSTDPQIVMNIILDILKTVSKSEPKILIRVNPAEVQFVKDNMPNALYELGIEAKINVVGDETLLEGGCKFETSNGIVDASIDAQTEIIKKALRGI